MIGALRAARERQETEPGHIAECITGEPIAEHMAGAIIGRLRRHGQCGIMDIKAMGFSLNDIARHWPEACQIAEQENSRWRILNG